MSRPNAAVVLSEQEREQLQALTRSRSRPHALIRRARIVLLSAAGLSNQAIAERCAVSPPTVSLWCQRYRTQGLAGLHDELRPGRPRTHGDEQVAALVNRVLHTKPKGATHWSVRLVAEETGFPRARWAVTSSSSDSNRSAPRVSNSPPTPSSWRRYATSWVLTSILPTTFWSRVWMKKAKSRRSNAPNQSCPWVRVTSNPARHPPRLL
jgi:transposase